MLSCSIAVVAEKILMLLLIIEALESKIYLLSLASFSFLLRVSGFYFLPMTRLFVSRLNGFDTKKNEPLALIHPFYIISPPLSTNLGITRTTSMCHSRSHGTIIDFSLPCIL
jgi:hypothetical protein